MSKGIDTKLAGQVGEFLVCAELGKRGFIATSFTGSVPEFDLIVANNSLKTLPVQVKTSRGISWPTNASLWIDIEIDETEMCQRDGGNKEISHPDLIYVCVLLARLDSDQRDRFFILTKKDIQEICSTNYREFISKHNWKRPRNFRSLDNRYYASNLEPFENNWDLFHEKLASS